METDITEINGVMPVTSGLLWFRVKKKTYRFNEVRHGRWRCELILDGSTNYLVGNYELFPSIEFFLVQYSSTNGRRTNGQSNIRLFSVPTCGTAGYCTKCMYMRLYCTEVSSIEYLLSCPDIAYCITAPLWNTHDHVHSAIYLFLDKATELKHTGFSCYWTQWTQVQRRLV